MAAGKPEDSPVLRRFPHGYISGPLDSDIPLVVGISTEAFKMTQSDESFRPLNRAFISDKAHSSKAELRVEASTICIAFDHIPVSEPRLFQHVKAGSVNMIKSRPAARYIAKFFYGRADKRNTPGISEDMKRPKRPPAPQVEPQDESFGRPQRISNREISRVR